MMMTMKTRATFSVLLGLLLFALLGLAMLPQAPAAAAPAAAPTPVSVTRPVGAEPKVVEVWKSRVITGDTTAPCIDVGAYSVVDGQWQIDQTAVNTVTVTTQWSIDGSLITDGADLVASNGADASDIQQAQVFGRYLCPMADVTNSNVVTVTLFVIAK
jgi:hypothetical protein